MTRWGMTVGVVYPYQPDDEKRAAYRADITYATNNELGFDYLRDNMKGTIEEMAQRGHYFAIVDEVDSILVDEARTPLIISGPSQDRSDLYQKVDALYPGSDRRAFQAGRKDPERDLHRRGQRVHRAAAVGGGFAAGRPIVVRPGKHDAGAPCRRRRCGRTSCSTGTSSTSSRMAR